MLTTESPRRVGKRGFAADGEAARHKTPPLSPLSPGRKTRGEGDEPSVTKLSTNYEPSHDHTPVYLLTL